jgi:hypothetical protein
VAPIPAPPTHLPVESMTVIPLTDTDVGWMSPLTSFARNAYGTLPMVARGVISASVPTWMPR